MGGLFGRLAKNTSANPEPWFIDWLHGGQKSATGLVVSPQKAMRDVIVMACVSIRAVDFAKLPGHVFRTQSNGGKTIVKNHALERLLHKPNSFQTWLEFAEQMGASYLLRGNAYAAILRDGRARPIALIPVNPESVCVYAAPDGDLYYRVNRVNDHQRAMLAAFPDLIPAADMLHLRALSMDGLLGMSRVGMSREAIGLSLALEEYSARLFSNGTMPGGVLQTDKRLTDPVFKRTQQQWQDKYSGLENAGKTPILEEGLKWIKQSMTAIEAQTVEARRLQIEQLATAFDVPLHRLGIIPEGGGPAIIQAHQMYLNNTLSSDAERWESKLNDAFGLDGEEMFVEFDLDYFNRADIQTRMTAYRTAVVGMIGTPNEMRRREGWPDIEGGDTLYQPTNVAPIGFMPAGGETGPGSDVTGAPAPGGDGDPAAVPDA